MLHRPGSRGSRLPTSPGSRGAWSATTTSWSRWTPTAHTSLSTPSLLAAPTDLDADMVKGSRWMRGGATDQTRSRELFSRLANIYIQVAMDIPVRDATGGYNAFRSSILRKVDLTGVASKGYTFQVDMTRRVLAAGGKVVEAGPSRLSNTLLCRRRLRFLAISRSDSTATS